MNTENKEVPPIYIISGGAGASGEQLAHTALAQFPKGKVPVITTGHVRQVEQVEAIVAQAEATGGIIVHTLVDVGLRHMLMRLAQERNLITIDLMGDLLSRLADALGQEPIGQPGLYRELNRAYFDRIAAIKFAMVHDDGKNPEGWPQAEIVLVGVSRTGKTPLSMYLSVLGWKVANVSLVMGIPPSPKLFQLDRRRVIGLTLEPGQLLAHRRQRQRHLGTSGSSAYTDPATVYEETDFARRVFRKGRFSKIDVTDKPIETSAEEVIRLITRQLKTESHK